MATIYLVTECCDTNNLLIHTWVCKDREAAEDCLKYLFRESCRISRLRGAAEPLDCTHNGFFYWDADEGLTFRYEIQAGLAYIGEDGTCIIEGK